MLRFNLLQTSFKGTITLLVYYIVQTKIYDQGSWFVFCTMGFLQFDFNTFHSCFERLTQW